MNEETKNLLAALAEKIRMVAQARQGEALAYEELSRAILDALNGAHGNGGTVSVEAPAPVAERKADPEPEAALSKAQAPVAPEAPAPIDDATLRKLVVDCYAAGKGAVVQAFLAFAGKARVGELDDAGKAQLAAEIRSKGVA